MLEEQRRNGSMPKAPMLKARMPGACAPWPAHLRLQACTCLALAAKATEHWVAASLTELAEELLDRAIRAVAATVRLEAGLRSGSRRPGSASKN
jgi:hypothetical protein